MDRDSEDGWLFEGEAIACGLAGHVFDLAGCVELPLELRAHADAECIAARLSDDFDEWLIYLSE